MKSLKKSYGRNGRTCQRTHLQNHRYANKSRRTYVRDVRQLSNPDAECFAYQNLIAVNVMRVLVCESDEDKQTIASDKYLR